MNFNKLRELAGLPTLNESQQSTEPTNEVAEKSITNGGELAPLLAWYDSGDENYPTLESIVKELMASAYQAGFEAGK
jgi:hypothetical protein